MLASLADDVLRQVVGGGVVTIPCEPWPDSYDHKRHHAHKEGQGPALDGQAPIWDFVVTQRNGTRVRFHPQQTTSKVKVVYVRDGGVAPPEPPAAGLGESEGPGTYKHYKEASYPQAPRVPAPRDSGAPLLPAIAEHPPGPNTEAPSPRGRGWWWYRDASGDWIEWQRSWRVPAHMPA